MRGIAVRALAWAGGTILAWMGWTWLRVTLERRHFDRQEREANPYARRR